MLYNSFTYTITPLVSTVNSRVLKMYALLRKEEKHNEHHTGIAHHARKWVSRTQIAQPDEADPFPENDRQGEMSFRRTAADRSDRTPEKNKSSLNSKCGQEVTKMMVTDVCPNCSPQSESSRRVFMGMVCRII